MKPKLPNIETLELRKFKLDKSHRAFLKVHSFREISSMVIPIFIQLLFNVMIAQINLIIINWYDGGRYADLVSRATLAYTVFQFIPMFVSTGVIIVCGNIIGEGKPSEISKIVISGMIINLIVNISLSLLLDLFANQICGLLNSGSITKDEKQFVAKFYRVLNVQLIVASVLFVFIGSLQSLKKSTHVTIGSIISNIIDVSFVSIVLFVLKADPIWVAASISIAIFLQTIYMIVMNFKFIDFKVYKWKQFSPYYIKKVIIAGIPITFEMMTYNITAFVIYIAISYVNIGNGYGKETSVTIFRNLNSLIQYLGAWCVALGTTSTVFVSQSIGEKNVQKAYDYGLDSFKVGIFSLIIVTILFTAASYPILKIFNTDTRLIVSYGYLFVFIVCVKQTFDTGNLIILRSLWAIGDLWTPIFVSGVTMIFGNVFLPVLIVFILKLDGMIALILLLMTVGVDPLMRTVIYFIRWFKGSWIKKIILVKPSVGVEQN